MKVPLFVGNGFELRYLLVVADLFNQRHRGDCACPGLKLPGRRVVETAGWWGANGGRGRRSGDICATNDAIIRRHSVAIYVSILVEAWPADLFTAS